jgi:hypothetical protein
MFCAPADQKLIGLVTVGHAAEKFIAPKRSLADVIHREKF